MNMLNHLIMVMNFTTMIDHLVVKMERLCAHRVSLKVRKSTCSLPQLLACALNETSNLLLDSFCPDLSRKCAQIFELSLSLKPLSILHVSTVRYVSEGIGVPLGSFTRCAPWVHLVGGERRKAKINISS